MNEGRWRVGKTLGRTLYLDDVVVGMVDTRELALAIVTAMNGHSQPGIVYTQDCLADPPMVVVDGLGRPVSWHPDGGQPDV